MLLYYGIQIKIYGGGAHREMSRAPSISCLISLKENCQCCYQMSDVSEFSKYIILYSYVFYKRKIKNNGSKLWAITQTHEFVIINVLRYVKRITCCSYTLNWEYTEICLSNIREYWNFARYIYIQRNMKLNWICTRYIKHW